MALVRRRRFLFLLFLLLLFLLSIYLMTLRCNLHRLSSNDFSHFNNETGAAGLIVPNLVHYVHLDHPVIDFVTFICILSAFYNHQPTAVYFHTNVGPAVMSRSAYFSMLEAILGSRLVVSPLARPTHVFGQQLASVHHASDVARIQVLMQHGGIYLDEDVFVVRSLNSYRRFEFALGWPDNQSMGTQVLVAHKNARFLRLWLESYREYRASMWYYNAGEGPTATILASRPHLVHRVKAAFGVENLAEHLYTQYWSAWTDRDAIHLLSNHKYLTMRTVDFDPDNVASCRCTFSVMAEQMLDHVARDYGEIRQEQRQLAINRFLAQSSGSLLKKHLSQDVYTNLRTVVTRSFNSSLWDVIRSGLAHADSDLGVYAPDAEAYDRFGELLMPIVRDYHRLEGHLLHPAPYWGEEEEEDGISGIAQFASPPVVSTRIRLARSLEGFPLNSKMTKDELLSLEGNVSSSLSQLRGELEGEYVSLSQMSQEEQQRLQQQHLLFTACDRYLIDAGACRYWPTGRGIFLNKDRSLAIWVNEEDHLRIISMEQGGDLASVFKRLRRVVRELEKVLTFVRHPELGHLTFCPSNIGTTLRSSVHLRLPKLRKANLVEKEANKRGIQVRGSGGEHTKVLDGILDLSNRKRLGITEFHIVREMFQGIQQLIEMERSLPD